VRALSFATLALAPLALAALGCGKDPEPTPIATPTPTTTTTTGDTPPTASVRLVGWRNPYGDTLHPDNLMIDGDFEFTGRSGQMPWVLYGSNGQAALDFDTGGRCRSGVRCARLLASATMIGYLASPKEKNLAIRAWGKPESGRCGDVSFSLVDETSNQLRATLVPQQPDADELGWCRYEVVTKSLSQYPYPYGNPALVVTTKKAGGALIDDVVALPSPDGTKPLLEGRPLSDAEKTEILSAVEFLKRNRQFGVPPRNGPNY
jgi:hypothetical protein